jgi:hypothetical protein
MASDEADHSGGATKEVGDGREDRRKGQCWALGRKVASAQNQRQEAESLEIRRRVVSDQPFDQAEHLPRRGTGEIAVT